MEDQKQKLLLQMALKVNELSTYNFIKIILSLLLIFEVILCFLGYVEYNKYYWFFFLFFLLSNYHLEKKYNTALQEYQELKDEFILRFEDENNENKK